MCTPKTFRAIPRNQVVDHLRGPISLLITNSGEVAVSRLCCGRRNRFPLKTDSISHLSCFVTRARGKSCGRFKFRTTFSNLRSIANSFTVPFVVVFGKLEQIPTRCCLQAVNYRDSRDLTTLYSLSFPSSWLDLLLMNQRKSPLLASAQVSNFESVDVKRLLLFGGKLLFTLSELEAGWSFSLRLSRNCLVSSQKKKTDTAPAGQTVMCDFGIHGTAGATRPDPVLFILPRKGLEPVAVSAAIS